MRKLIPFIIILFSFKASCQQSTSLEFLLPNSTDNIALFGIGSISSEALKDINSSGKFSGAIKLDHSSTKRKMTFFISANRNANNSDTTLASTLLFPEVGKAAFIGTLNSIWTIDNKAAKPSQFIGGFIQGSFKSINGKRSIKSTGQDTTALFTILDWEAGIRYIKDAHNLQGTHALFSAAFFINYYNIPDEDNEDYRLIFNQPNMPSDFWAFGAKITYEVNHAQIFGDFRHVFGTPEKIPNRELRGFSLNVGFVFNVDILKH